MLLTLSPVVFASNFEHNRDWERIFWDGGTVTLDGDMYVSDRIFVNGDTVLDLNGYTMTCTAGEPIIICNNATLTVTGDGEIQHVNTEYGNPLFIVSNVVQEFTEPVFDEQGNPLFEGGVEESSGVGRLILENGTYSSSLGELVVVLDGAEAEFGTGGACTLIASGRYATCIRNFGNITAIANTEMISAEVGVVNLGTIETIDGCEITSPQNNIENYGKIEAVTNTHLTSTRTDGVVSLNNQGYIGTVGDGVKFDSSYIGIVMTVHTASSIRLHWSILEVALKR